MVVTPSAAPDATTVDLSRQFSYADSIHCPGPYLPLSFRPPQKGPVQDLCWGFLRKLLLEGIHHLLQVFFEPEGLVAPAREEDRDILLSAEVITDCSLYTTDASVVCLSEDLSKLRGGQINPQRAAAIIVQIQLFTLPDILGMAELLASLLPVEILQVEGNITRAHGEARVLFRKLKRLHDNPLDLVVGYLTPTLRACEAAYQRDETANGEAAIGATHHSAGPGPPSSRSETSARLRTIRTCSGYSFALSVL